MYPKEAVGPERRPLVPEFAAAAEIPVKLGSPDRVQLVKSPVSKPQFNTRFPATPSQILATPLTALEFEGHALTVTFPACARKLKDSTAPHNVMYFRTMNNPLIWFNRIASNPLGRLPEQGGHLYCPERHPSRARQVKRLKSDPLGRLVTGRLHRIHGFIDFIHCARAGLGSAERCYRVVC